MLYVCNVLPKTSCCFILIFDFVHGCCCTLKNSGSTNYLFANFGTSTNSIKQKLNKSFALGVRAQEGPGEPRRSQESAGEPRVCSGQDFQSRKQNVALGMRPGQFFQMPKLLFAFGGMLWSTAPRIQENDLWGYDLVNIFKIHS